MTSEAHLTPDTRHLTPIQVDSLTLAAVRQELLEDALEARVSRVDQPARSQVFLELQRGKQRLGLFIAADPRLARIHQVATRPPRPPVPSAFTLLLRKHLEGCRLADVTQPNLDRLLHLHFAGRSAIGEPQQLVLAAEIMGKYSNVVLYRQPEGLILGSLSVVDESLSDRRWIGPGERYTLPVLGDRPQWYDLTDPDRLGEALQGLIYQQRTPRRLAERIGGLSPAGWRYVLALAGPEAAAANLAPALARLKAIVDGGEFLPHLTAEGYSVLPPPAVELEPLPISVLLEDYYGAAERAERLGRLRRELNAVLDRELERNRKKETLYAGQAGASGEAEAARHLGDLLMANLHAVPPGATELTVEDYLTGEPLTIALDPLLAPAANGQAYYRRYRKLAATVRQAHSLLVECRHILAYLEQIQLTVELAEEAPDLEEVREELAREGLIKAKRAARAASGKPKAPEVRELLQFRSSQGLTILAGKNNRQNDYLTLKLAHAKDIWLHTQIIPGAHVIVRTEGGKRQVPEASLLEAAQIAAYYSQARLSSRVPVVFTERRHVAKPNGAKPGMVIYEQERTLFVTPDAEAVAALKASGSLR